jgi:mono/diheme cytochrome c family protein
MLLAIVALGGCSGGGGSETAPTSPPPRGTLAHDIELQRGRKLFAAHCAECHGFSGQGGVGPTFNDGRLLRAFADNDAQVAFVKQGKGVMPGFAGQLSDPEIRAIVRYEREVLSVEHP